MKTVATIGLLLVIALAAFFHVQRRGYSDHEHERFQGSLWRLKHLDASFNEDLLRVRFSMLESYDDFQRYLDEMDRLMLGLQQAPRFVSEAGGQEIRRSAETFSELLNQRRQAFERFKSRNAVLANSRRYFPIAVHELQLRLTEAEADRSLNRIVQELTRVLLAHATSTEELPAEALALPARFQAWLVLHPRHDEVAFVSSLSRHGDQLLSGKSELDGLTRLLLTLPTASGIGRLSAVYEQELAIALQHTQQYRTLLYVAGALLVLVAGYAFWALRDANRGLEARVIERTRQMQAEMEERKRTEAALQSSEAFLHSLVENLPVYIFRKDRAGKIMFANKLFCERFHRSHEQIVGTTVFDFLPFPEAERQQRMEEKIMASGETYHATDEQITVNGESTFIHLIKVPVFDTARECVGLQGMFLDVTERKRAENEVAKLHEVLLETSRQAGMAEVATGVLHNVGNVLNSVNVSATLVAEHVRHSKATNLAKLVALFDQHQDNLAVFLTEDPRGRLIPGYLATLKDSITQEQNTVTAEIEHLQKNIQHIKDIVAMQQNYAKISGFIENVPVADLVEDALRMNAESLARHDVEVIRDFQIRPVISTDKHKIMQILVNLVRNAKFACDDANRDNLQITVRIAGAAQALRISVADNGVGIPADNLTRIFNHGFTTRKHGHGFGLHSGALAARELGGSLTVQSEGPGCGATFTLELPFHRETPTP